MNLILGEAQPGGLLTPYLTRPQGEALASQQAATVPGMAFWAMTGPEGETCRTCKFWGVSSRFRRNPEGYLLPRRCMMFTRLSHGAIGAGIPDAQAACKYFKAREKAPEQRKPKGEGAE